MRTSSVAAALVALAATACGRADAPGGEAGANVRVDAVLAVGTLSRVEIEVQPANIVTSLTPSATNGSFSGSILVPAGRQTFTARAYAPEGTSGERLVGTGSAGPIDIPAGGTAEVNITILDSTGDLPQPNHGPIITSFTVSSTSPPAGASITLTGAAIDPDGDPIPIAWSQSPGCHGEFGSPSLLTTTWHSDTAEGCTLTLTAGSGTLSDSRSVVVVTRAAGTALVSGYYLPNPFVRAVTVASTGNHTNICNLSRAPPPLGMPEPWNASCGRYEWVTGEEFQLSYWVDVGTTLSPAPVMSLTSDCGATIVDRAGPNVFTGTIYSGWFQWTAPASSGLCLLNLRVENQGLVGNLRLAFWITQPECADDPAEQDDVIDNAYRDSDLSAQSNSYSFTRIPNDEDWVVVVRSYFLYTSLTATATNAALPMEIWCGTRANDAASANRVASGVGSVTAGGFSTMVDACWVRVLPEPARTACASAYTLNITARP